MIAFRGNITIQDIYNNVSELDLFRYYCPGFRDIRQPFKSEFREDGNPSCWIRVSNSGNLYYRDYGETDCYGPLQYVCRKFGVDLNTALSIIDQDFNLNLTSGGNTTTNRIIRDGSAVVPKSHNRPIIHYKARPWVKRDADYWLQYGIHKSTLVKYGVVPISHFWRNGRVYTCNPMQPTYIYIYYDDMYKVYQPMNDGFKWYCNNDMSVVQGIKVLPKEGGDLLIITSSLKDVMTLHEFGYWAIAPIAENTFIPDTVFEKLKTKWDRIVLMFDNDFGKDDNPGVRFAKQFSDQYGLEYYHTPDNTEKDISDFRKSYGQLKTRELLKEQLISWEEFIAS